MNRFLKSLVFLLMISTSVLAQNTSGFLHPDVWLRADQQNGVTTYWQDVSGNQHNAFFSTGNSLPNGSILNFNPCFLFDGNISPFKVSYDLGNTKGMTIIIAYQTKDSTNERGIWAVVKDTSGTQRLTTQKINGESMTVKYRDRNDTIGIINTFSFAWKEQTVDSVADVFHLGGTDSLAFRGKIAECLIYPEMLQQKDKHVMQSYLCLKYGVTLLGLDYLNSKGDTIWSNTSNTGFTNGIIGIGRDTTLNLNQKQATSTSSKDILTIGAGTIDSTNEQNTYSINEGDFLICGNNNLAPVIGWLDTGQTNGILQRQWLMQKTGMTAIQIPTAMEVNLAGIISDTVTCRLVISRVVDSGLNLSNLDYYMPDSISNNKIAYFSNIHWDTDNNGKDLFSIYFMKQAPLLVYHPNTTPVKKDSLQHGIHPVIPSPEISKEESQATGIPSTTLQLNSYRLYPNPTRGTFDLEVSLKSSGWLHLQVIDNQGKVIQTFSGDNNNLYHYTGKIETPGTYYVEITIADDHKVFPIIVQ